MYILHLAVKVDSILFSFYNLFLTGEYPTDFLQAFGRLFK